MIRIPTFDRKSRDRSKLTRHGEPVESLPLHVINRRNRQLGLLRPLGNDRLHLIMPYVNMVFKASVGGLYATADDYLAVEQGNKKHKVSSLIYNLLYHGGRNVSEICEKFPQLINALSNIPSDRAFNNKMPSKNVHPLNAALATNNLQAFIYLLRLGSHHNEIYYGDNMPFEYANAILRYMDPRYVHVLAKAATRVHSHNLAPYYLLIQYYNSLPNISDHDMLYLRNGILRLPEELKEALSNHGVIPNLYY